MVTVKRFQVLLEENYHPAFDLKIFEHDHIFPLPEAVEKNPNNLEKLVDQFLWINTSLGNWSYVLRALELKMKRAGEEKEDLNYEKMLREVN